MRKKSNISEVGEGLRTPDDSFFDTITRCEHKQQVTPFIFYLDGKVIGIWKTPDLFRVANDNDIIIKGWVGNWKTDMFAFKVSELKEYIKRKGLKILNVDL